MSQKENVNDIASKTLTYNPLNEVKKYSPNILVSIPRNLSIEYLGVKMEDLPGDGFDLWYNYEFRCLTNNGLPLASLIKFIFPHSTKNIIESKSFKLYCNGFTTERLGDIKEEALSKACEIMKKDLSKMAEGNIDVSFLSYKSERNSVFETYKELTEIVDPKIKVDKYNEDPSLLEVEEYDSVNEYRFKFDALRSKCRITKQPDTGTFYLYYKSKKHIKEDSLVRYFSSFYEENHFHEEILITSFTRFSRLLNEDDELFTMGLYQRRGSLDIGPCHYKNLKSGSLEEDIISKLKNPKVFVFDPNNLYR